MRETCADGVVRQRQCARQYNARLATHHKVSLFSLAHIMALLSNAKQSAGSYMARAAEARAVNRKAGRKHHSSTI